MEKKRRKRKGVRGLVWAAVFCLGAPVSVEGAAVEMAVKTAEKTPVKAAVKTAVEMEAEVTAGTVRAESGPEQETASYAVSFVDGEDPGTRIFPAQEGEVAWGTVLEIAFPERIVGADGYFWEAELPSPQQFAVYGAGTEKMEIPYRRGQQALKTPEDAGQKKLEQWMKTAWEADCAITGYSLSEGDGRNAIVRDEAENNRRIRELLSAVRDGDWHVFYLIGEDFSPRTGIIGAEYDAVYAVMEGARFLCGGKEYAVYRVRVKKNWDPETCPHVWELTAEEKKSCLSHGTEDYRCGLCGTEKQVIWPAPGHGDENGDSLCDRCGQRAFAQAAGSRIRAIYRSGQEEWPLGFTCVDEDYGGSGKMLYVCDSALPQEITGPCFAEAEYESSHVRRFLNYDFANGISLGAALCPREETAGGPADLAFLLSAEEYTLYEASGLLPTSDPFFLRSPAGAGQMYRVSAGGVEAADCQDVGTGVRPAILLERPDVQGTAEPMVWKEGDVQMRQVGEQILSFTCVEEDYSDWQDGHRKAALFLCDRVIRADVDADPQAASLTLLRFGENNNYKTSEVRKWLEEKGDADSFSLEPIHTGVQTACTGSTAAGDFEQLSQESLVSHEIGYQLMDDRLFCLSVEEALGLREWLWRFGSGEKNPQSQMSAYSQGYYLRTPYYETDETGKFQYGQRIYAVCLDGSIRPVAVDSETMGLRPAFAVPQP